MHQVSGSAQASPHSRGAALSLSQQQSCLQEMFNPLWLTGSCQDAWKAFLHSWKDRSVQMLSLGKEQSVIPGKSNRNFQFGFPWSVAQNLPDMHKPQIIGSELIRIYGVRGLGSLFKQL